MKFSKKILALATAFVTIAAITAPVVASAQTITKTKFTLIKATFLGYSSIDTSPGNSGNIMSKESWYYWDFVTTDLRVGGALTIHGGPLVIPVSNPVSNWGPGHGTWVMDVNNDGKIEWQGVVHIMPDPRNFTTIYSGEGVGDYKGLSIKMGDHDSIFDGEIINPKTP